MESKAERRGRGSGRERGGRGQTKKRCTGKRREAEAAGRAES